MLLTRNQQVLTKIWNWCFRVKEYWYETLGQKSRTWIQDLVLLLAGYMTLSQLFNLFGTCWFNLQNDEWESLDQTRSLLLSPLP